MENVKIYTDIIDIFNVGIDKIIKCEGKLTRIDFFSF
jgi:hypothetical protein